MVIRGAFWQRGVVLATLAFLISACGEDPPALPHEETLLVPSLPTADNSGALVGDGSTDHVAMAAASVGVVTAAVNLALLTPRLIWLGVVTQEPARDGDKWIWEKTFPLIGGEAQLHAWRDGDRVKTEMHVTGLRDGLEHLDDFVWYEGSHGEGAGQWLIYDAGTPSEPGPEESVVAIDWTREDESHKSLVFENTRPNSSKNGDSLTYALEGTSASMTIHDERSGDADDGASEDFSVVWDVEDGSGRMSAGGEDFCWDTLDNGQVDIECP